MNKNKKDFLMAAVAGFLTALCILPIIKNIQLKISAAYIFALLAVGIPILWILALIVGRFLSRWLSWIRYFVKFCIVGFLNAAIDFGVLNLLSYFTGITKGFIIGGVNIPGFIAAATNSYFWNKFWVFSGKRKEGEKTDYSDIPAFIIVVVCGALLNSGVVVFISTYIPPFFNLSPERWLNIAKVVASAVALIWNFIGFKFLVFKKQIEEKPTGQNVE
jgi:putative flippase GtrA